MTVPNLPQPNNNGDIPWHLRAACNPQPPFPETLNHEIFSRWAKEKARTNNHVAHLLQASGRPLARSNEELSALVDPDWWFTSPRECSPSPESASSTSSASSGTSAADPLSVLHAADLLPTDAQIVTAPHCLAKQICREACPVRNYCYAQAATSRVPPSTSRSREQGIWGGEYFSPTMR